jgi:hypothetical protein
MICEKIRLKFENWLFYLTRSITLRHVEALPPFVPSLLARPDLG